MSILENNQDLKTAVAAVKAAGLIVRENFGRCGKVIRKSPKEMVSEVDMKSQQAILDVLKSYDNSYGIVTEEIILSHKSGDKIWVVDPIDGTHNYIAGLPFSGISVGLACEDDFLVGAIYFPMEEELYYAVKGESAFCNGSVVKVSDNRDLSKAIINYDNQFHLSSKSFDYYRRLTERAFTTRIFGTATKDICLTASGKIDGRIWLKAKICDIAAGIVIINEAGGSITTIDGQPCTMESERVVASNGKVHAELLEIFKEVE